VSWLDSVLAFVSRLLGGPQSFTDQPPMDFGRSDDEAANRRSASIREGGIATGIRKRVGDLTLDDLDASACWEFATDELDVDGQDEETVRPRPDRQVADPAHGLAIVSAHFNAKDGTKYRGYYYVSADGGLASQQPTVVTGAAQVNFWLGMFPPSQAVLDAYLATLDTDSKRLFPLSFKGDLPAVGHKASGVIPSFRKWNGKPNGDAV
jgi:hypothetical protein